MFDWQVQSQTRATAKDMSAMAVQFDEKYRVTESAASLAKVTFRIILTGVPIKDV